MSQLAAALQERERIAATGAPRRKQADEAYKFTLRHNADSGEEAKRKMKQSLMEALREATKHNRSDKLRFVGDFFSALRPQVQVDLEAVRRSRAMEKAWSELSAPAAFDEANKYPEYTSMKIDFTKDTSRNYVPDLPNEPVFHQQVLLAQAPLHVAEPVAITLRNIVGLAKPNYFPSTGHYHGTLRVIDRGQHSQVYQ